MTLQLVKIQVVAAVRELQVALEATAQIPPITILAAMVLAAALLLLQPTVAGAAMEATPAAAVAAVELVCLGLTQAQAVTVVTATSVS